MQTPRQLPPGVIPQMDMGIDEAEVGPDGEVVKRYAPSDSPEKIDYEVAVFC